MSWLDDMSPDEYFKRMAAAQKGTDTPGTGKFTIGDKKSVEEFTAEIKKSIAPQKVFNDLMAGQKQVMLDVTKELKEFDEELENAKDTIEAREIQDKKDAVVRQATNRNLKASAVNLGMGFAQATGTMLSGIAEFAKGLLSNQGGVELATGLAAKTARATGEAVGSVGSAISGIGSIAAMFMKNFGIIGKVFTVLAMVAGPLIERFSGKAAELAEEGIKILGDELVKTRENFKKITGAGALFAGGMTEMRQQAGRAGLTVEDFGNAIKNNTASLSAMGMGVAQASKRMAGITGELRRGDMGKQLQNLGYSFEEFAGLSAQTAARLNASGKLRTMSDADVAKATAAYGKDLKILQGITGEDAKKKMEEARVRSMEADLLAEAMAKGGPEAVTKLQNQLATMPDTMKKGYMEFVSSGGNAIADAATNVAITQNPKIMEQYQQMYRTLGDGSKDASAALKETGLLTANTAQYARDHAGAFKDLATSVRMGADGVARDTVDIHNALIMTNQTITTASVNASAEAAEKLSKTADPLTKSVHALETSTYNMKVAVEQSVTPLLGRYATHLSSMLESVESIVKKINAAMSKIDADKAEKAKGDNEKFGEVAGGAAGALILGPLLAGLGSVIGPVGTVVGGMIGTALGGWLGSKAGGFLGSLFDDSKSKAPATPAAATAPVKKFSQGGITKGVSIAGEAGPEAVVPLPDGRTIPVSIKQTSSTSKVTPPTGKAAANKAAGDSFSSIADSMFNVAKTISPVIGVVGELGKMAGTAIMDKMAPSVNSGSMLQSGDTKNQELIDFLMKSKEDNKTSSKEVSDGLARVSAIMQSQAASSASTDSTMKELVGLIRAQLTKHDQMIEKLNQGVDINQRLLTNSYS